MAAEALPAPDAAREPPSAAGERHMGAALDRALATDATLAEFDAVRAAMTAMLPVPADGLRDAVDAWERDGASPDLLDALDAERAERWPLADVVTDTLEWDDDVLDPPREWLIRDYLPANRVLLFTGAGGAGKSRLALQLGAALAAGVPEHWLPSEALLRSGALGPDKLTPDPDKAAPVVFASYEDEADEAQRRLRRLAAGGATGKYAGKGRLGYAEPSARDGRLHYMDLAGAGPIWGPAHERHVSSRAKPLPAWDRVTKFAASVRARLLILDPSAGAFGSNENDRAAVREFVSALDRWAREHDCAVLLVSHPPKPPTDAKAKAAKYSGSTDWRNAARTVWTLGECGVKECKCGRLVLEVDKASYVKRPEPVHVEDLWRDAGGAWANVDGDARAQADADDVLRV